MVEPQEIAQFLQHAHHRIEGRLVELQEGLSRGHVEPVLLERAVWTLRQHMYTEEELLFPQAEEGLAEAVADLQGDHGRISDVVDQMRALLRQGPDASRIQALTTVLMGLLAIHNAKEDLGIYPDLVALFDPGTTQAVLREVEKAEPPPEWVCAARRL